MTSILRNAALAVAAAALLALPLLGARPAPTETRRPVWVYLDAAAVRDAPVRLGEAALRRRRAQQIPLYDNDRTIPDRVLRRIAATGAEVRTASRWLRAVSVDASPAELAALARLGFVARIEPVRALAVTDAARNAVRGARAEEDSAFYGVNYRALNMLGIPRVHDLGFTGSGVRVAILDTGFERQHEALFGRIVGSQYDFIYRDSIVANQPGEPGDQERQGTWVWSLLGAFLPGLIVGPAYNATFYLAKVDLEPGDTRLDEDRWVAAAEWADSLGVNIISSSVTFRYEFTDGTDYQFPVLDGNTTPTTRAADEAARRGILVVQSIGMTLLGDGSLAAPGDADDIMTVGAVDYAREPVHQGTLASARGPTASGRTKPDVVAPALDLVAATSATLDGVDRGLTGTVFATPLIAGGAAQFMEAWPSISRNPVAIRRAFRLSAHNANNPDNRIGWGVPDVASAIMFPEGLDATTVVQSDPNGIVNSIAPTFSWSAPLVHPATRPIQYVLEVARDTGFTQLLARDTTVDAFSVQLEHALTAGTTFYWRVVATSRNGIVRRSTLGRAPSGTAFTVPDWVRQLNLTEANATTDSTRPTLRWSALDAPPPAGPFTFDVEVLARDRTVVERERDLSGTTRAWRVPSPLSPNAAYTWRVIARSATGVVDTVESVQPFVVNAATAPPATLLYQNFPNPFPRLDLGFAGTNVWFDLANESDVQLSVHDLRGRLVRALIPRVSCPSVRLPAGSYGRPGADPIECVLTRWDGRDESGERVPGGIYVLRLVADGKVEYRRMLYQPQQ